MSTGVKRQIVSQYSQEERFSYLKDLLHEFQVTKSEDARLQVLANLANFCYDPINYDHLRRLNIPRIFLDLLGSPNLTLVEFAIGGLCNLTPDPINIEIIIGYNGVERIKRCLNAKPAPMITSALTTLIFINSTFNVFQEESPEGFVDKLEELKASSDPRVRNLALILLESRPATSS